MKSIPMFVLALSLIAADQARALPEQRGVKYSLQVIDRETQKTTQYFYEIRFVSPCLNDLPCANYQILKTQEGVKKPVINEIVEWWDSQVESYVAAAQDCPPEQPVIGFDATKSKVRKDYSFKISKRKSISPRICYQFHSKEDAFVESATSADVPYGDVHVVTTSEKTVQDYELISIQ